jgi:hypothetical protein
MTTQEDLSGLVGRLEAFAANEELDAAAWATQAEVSREAADRVHVHNFNAALLSEAATALTETAAELERVRKALEGLFADDASATPEGWWKAITAARQALSPEPEGDLGSATKDHLE